MVDPFRQGARKLFRITRLERTLIHLVDGNQKSRFTIDHDFLDAANGGGDDGRFARHRFEIDDPERLVNGRTAENGGVRIEIADGLLVDHLVDPDDPGAFGLHFLDGFFHFRSDLRRIRGTGAQHDLKAGIHPLDRANQMNDAFLAGDSSDEEQVGLGGIDAVLRQSRGGVGLSIFFEIDSVVNHVQPLRPDFEQAFDIRPGVAGNGDDRIRHFQGGLLDPEREIVSTAELFAFPGPEGLERMDRNNQRQAVIHLRQNPAEMAVPGMAMDQIGLDPGRVKIGATPDRAEDGLQRRRTGKIRRIEIEPSDGKIAVIDFLVTKASNLDRHRPGELAREIIDVDPRSAINVRRIFVREEERLHEGLLIVRATKRTQIPRM